MSGFNQQQLNEQLNVSVLLCFYMELARPWNTAGKISPSSRKTAGRVTLIPGILLEEFLSLLVPVGSVGRRKREKGLGEGRMGDYRYTA